MKEITNAYRDEESGAVIMDDSDAYNMARNRKRLAQEKKSKEEQLKTLNTRLNRMEDQLNELIRYMKNA